MTMQYMLYIYIFLDMYIILLLIVVCKVMEWGVMLRDGMPDVLWLGSLYEEAKPRVELVLRCWKSL